MEAMIRRKEYSNILLFLRDGSLDDTEWDAISDSLFGEKNLFITIKEHILSSKCPLKIKFLVMKLLNRRPKDINYQMLMLELISDLLFCKDSILFNSEMILDLLFLQLIQLSTLDVKFVSQLENIIQKTRTTNEWLLDLLVNFKLNGPVGQIYFNQGDLEKSYQYFKLTENRERIRELEGLLLVD